MAAALELLHDPALDALIAPPVAFHDLPGALAEILARPAVCYVNSSAIPPCNAS